MRFKCVFSYVYILVLDFSSAAVHQPSEFVSENMKFSSKRLRVLWTAFPKGVDKWSLFGETFPHSEAINLLWSKQLLSTLSCTERRPGRINVMMRALDGDWEGDLGVRDKQTQLSLMDSFEKISICKSCVGLCSRSFPTIPIQARFLSNIWLLLG